jgi:hypothetical protein
MIISDSVPALPCPDQPHCTEEEWQAYWRIGQIKEIASLGFARRLTIAREEGLLAPLLAGDSDKVASLASECIALLSVRICWVYPQPLPEPSPQAEVLNSKE